MDEVHNVAHILFRGERFPKQLSIQTLKEKILLLNTSHLVHVYSMVMLNDTNNCKQENYPSETTKVLVAL